MDVNTWWDCDEKLRKAFNKPRDPEQSQVYFEALRDLPDAEVQQAVAAVIRTDERFPVPAKIREQVSQARAAAARERSVVPNFEPISDEKRDELVALIRGAREKIFGRGL